MRHRLLIALITAATAVACSPPTADDLVAGIIATRNEFEAEATSWIDHDVDTPNPSLYVEVIVVKNTEEQLTRLTVLVEQLDADSAVLTAQRIPIDVSDMGMRGLSKTYGIDVRPRQPGVEAIRLIIEPDPPAEVWDQFPELNSVRPRGR